MSTVWITTQKLMLFVPFSIFSWFCYIVFVHLQHYICSDHSFAAWKGTRFTLSIQTDMPGQIVYSQISCPEGSILSGSALFASQFYNSSFNAYQLLVKRNFSNFRTIMLTLVMLNKLRCHAHFWSSAVRSLDLDCCYKFTYLMANSADSDQLASEEANWSGSTLFAKAGYICVQHDKG